MEFETILKLKRLALEKAARVSSFKKRFLFNELLASLNRKPATLIPGLRGTGKTTLLLQLLNEVEEAFYVSMDSIILRGETLYSVAESLHRQGYSLLLFDEIHTYKGWEQELKNIYDDFPIKVVATASSYASVVKGSVYLGRRAELLELPPMTLRESHFFSTGELFTASMDDVFGEAALKWLANHPSAEKGYSTYLLSGGFPFHAKPELFSVVKRAIFLDALAEFSITRTKADVAEKLLGFLALSSPGEFSYSSFSNISGYSKATVYEVVALLESLGVLRLVREPQPSSQARELVKVMFSHPNIRASVAESSGSSPAIGALREEHFLFHASLLGLEPKLPKKAKKFPDYSISIGRETFVVEIGGPSKKRKQAEEVLRDENLIVLGFVQKSDQKS